MKGMFDDSKAFEAHSTIDAGMWMMHEITNKNGGSWDWETGQGTQFIFGKDDAEQVIIIMKDIASAKRHIGVSTYLEYKTIKLAKSLLPIVDTKPKVKRKSNQVKLF